MRRALAALACTLAAFAAVAAPRGVPKPVAEALRAAGVPLSSVAIVVEPASAGAPVVSHRARVPMNPASVMKLVTSYAALDLLGPAFTFRTDVLLRGTLRDGVLEGDLVLRGGGDPKLTYERVWQLAHQLRARGLREIRGDVVLDRTYFAPFAYDAGRFDNEPRRAYNVAPDALLANFDAIDFTFAPTTDGVRVTAEPDLPNVKVASRIAVVDGPCGAWRRNVRYDIEQVGLMATVVFSGTLPAECGERAWPLAVLDGSAFLESVFRWAWTEAGGRIAGRFRAGTTPPDARLFYRHESEPLANLLRDMNKFSNNVMARHLFLALSAERHAGHGTTGESAAIVRDWLAERDIEADGLVLENGSGLSRAEQASAATLAALLRRAWTSGVMPELAASLPLYAVDGTFGRRPGGTAIGRAHVKGGTLNGVQAIAGYVLDPTGQRWIAVMLVNHPEAQAARAAMDALVEWASTQRVRGGAR